MVFIPDDLWVAEVRAVEVEDWIALVEGEAVAIIYGKGQALALCIDGGIRVRKGENGHDTIGLIAIKESGCVVSINDNATRVNKRCAIIRVYGDRLVGPMVQVR